MSVCTDCNKKHLTDLNAVTTKVSEDVECQSVVNDENDLTDLNAVATQVSEDAECQSVVHETVCVQGTVTITPSLVSGTSTSFCVGNPIIGSCPGDLQQSCSFTVSQNICVQIPLTFSATASAVENGVVCGEPGIGACLGTTVCTHSVGYYRNNPTFTNTIITNAGGSIILGVNNLGLSFTVTTANANAVLSLNTPAPPAPTNPPFAIQYQNLYAQLLAANLNALNIEAHGVDVCSYAILAIEDANEFLANSPVGGTSGAPDYQEPLELFNTGGAPGCPVHCAE